MNSKHVILFLLVFSIGEGFAQLNETTDFPGAKKDDLFFDLRLGYPNWGAFNTERHVSGLETTSLTTTGIAPVSARFEIMLSNELSVALEGVFNSWGGEWTYVPELYDGDFNPIGEPVTTSYSAQRLRFLAGLKYHVNDINVDNLDVYGGVFIGTNRIWSEYESDDEDFRLENQNYFLYQELAPQFPISWSFRVGMRYFLSHNLGLTIEAGLGGPTISAGLSYRIRN